MSAQALWDTGATASAIQSSLVASLGLTPINVTTVIGVHGPQVCNVYLIDLHLPNGDVISNVQVTEAQDTDGWDVLVGMDVITLGDFSITTFERKTIFSFRIPSGGHIDYADQIVRERHSLLKRNRNAKCRVRHSGTGEEKVVKAKDVPALENDGWHFEDMLPN